MIMRRFQRFKLTLDLSEKTQRALFFAPTYEEGITRLFERVIQSGDLCVDVGANVGYYSILAASCGAKVIACEPENGNFGRLVDNVNLNNSAVTCLKIALGAEKGETSLHINPLNRGGNSLLSPKKYQTGSWSYTRSEVKRMFASVPLEQMVSVETLDDLIRERVKLIKIDVEGYESWVLRGGRNILATQAVRYIVCELSNAETRNATIRWLHELGYEPHKVDRRGALSPDTHARDLVFVAR
jgi:FkbM family methyltransferase